MARVNVDRMRKYASGDPFSEENLRALPPEQKRAIVEAMGFTPTGAIHTHDCPRNLSNGYVCQCAGEPTMWVGPKDVQAMMGDTWEQRVEARKKASPAVTGVY